MEVGETPQQTPGRGTELEGASDTANTFVHVVVDSSLFVLVGQLPLGEGLGLPCLVSKTPCSSETLPTL